MWCTCVDENEQPSKSHLCCRTRLSPDASDTDAGAGGGAVSVPSLKLPVWGYFLGEMEGGGGTGAALAASVGAAAAASPADGEVESMAEKLESKHASGGAK